MKAAPRLARLAFAIALALGAACWVGAGLAWAGMSDFLVVGVSDEPRPLEPFVCEDCFLLGSPRTVPEWVKVPLVLCPLLALTSGAFVGRARRFRALFAAASVVCGVSALLAIVMTVEVERAWWVERRFVQGDLFAPIFSLWYQATHARCAAAAAIVVAGSFALLAAIHRFRGRGPVVLAAAACAAAAWIAFERLGAQPDPAPPLAPWLRGWVQLDVRISVGAWMAVALGGVVWAFATREAPSRTTWGLTLAWLLLGVSLRLMTASYDVDLAHPPTLAHRPLTIPPSSGPRLPIVETCSEPRTYAFVVRLERGGYAESSLHDASDLERAGPSPIMGIESWDRDAPTDRLEPFLESALRRGVRDVDVTVQHLVPHESATYGAIHDRRVCVLRARLPELLGTRTYEELVNRARR